MRAALARLAHPLQHRVERGKIAGTVRADMHDRSGGNRRLLIKADKRTHPIGLRAERVVKLIIGPRVIRPFFGFAAWLDGTDSILCRIERAFRGGHIADDIIEGAACGALEHGVFCQAKGLQVIAGQQALIVEHFFEMRRAPVYIHRIAVKAAADMVVNASGCDMAQGQQRRIRRRAISGPLIPIQQIADHGLIREFRSLAEPAQKIVVIFQQAHRRLFEHRLGDVLRGAARPGNQAHEFGNRGGLFRHRGAAFGIAPILRQIVKRIEERVGRLIAGGYNRLPIGHQEQVVGPAPAPGQNLRGEHILRVNIGQGFAVHFDGDEILVHDPRNIRVVKAFLLHHMTPVTGRIPDREKDLHPARFGFGKGFRSPRTPVYRIMRVLAQIGRALEYQSVRIKRCACGIQIAGARRRDGRRGRDQGQGIRIQPRAGQGVCDGGDGKAEN